MNWVDIDNRFIACLDTEQDRFPAIRLQLSVPPSFAHMDDDDLFLPIQEQLILRPYNSNSLVLSINPTLCEVSVCVENFWCDHESGGNSGMPIRRGTAYVSGSLDTYKRLCGTKDRRFTQKPGKNSAQVVQGRAYVKRKQALQGTGSIRGFTQILQGGVKLRRMRKHIDGDQTRTAFWWVCIDYSKTHHFHCKSDPKCTPRRDKVVAFTNPTCLEVGELILERQAGNIHDQNAIAVVRSEASGGVGVVGYVPRELAMCLSPALDAGVIVIAGKGIYTDHTSNKSVSGAAAVETATVGAIPTTKLLIWFRVDRVAGVVSTTSVSGDISIEKALGAMQRWVPDTEVSDSSNPVGR